MNNFKDLSLCDEILKSIEELGFEKPTEIQQKAIPVLLESDKDIVGQAQTGTGKTAAFGIPLLQKIDVSSKDIQAIILTPTRELAIQVEKDIRVLGKYLDTRTVSIFGGTRYDVQIKQLKKVKPQIIVGTPGRVIDLINQKVLNLKKVSTCILDEADEMLNMGFFEDVQTILTSFDNKPQFVMFSATMPQSIERLIENSFGKSTYIKVKKKSLSNADIDQQYFLVREKHFIEALTRLIDCEAEMYGMVFCRTKIETKEVGDALKKRGYLVEVLNGDMGQAERNLVMGRFKDKKVDLLVCTDVAARGIDVNCLTHVFNYGIPQDNETYVHRIGRTGRAGMKGKAFTIVGQKMAFAIKKIEFHTKCKIKQGKLPSTDLLKKKVVEYEVNGAKLILDAIEKKGDEFQTDQSYTIFKEEFDHLSGEELMKLMFTWKFNKRLRHYDALEDIEFDHRSDSGNFRKRSSNRRSSSNSDRSSGRNSGRSSRRRSSPRQSRRG